ncbi:hypothetical protein VU04_02600 [Desulfobulbus sp. TB]|nr:hypothetical protein [Desulfobulbus sp. TB]
MNKDNHKAYAEACNIIRHYSNASMTVRVMSVVQGIAILGGWVVAMNGGKGFHQQVLPMFGIIFTFLLYRFHLGYFNATAYFYELASKMEQTLFDEEFRPIDSYHNYHEDKYKGLFGKLFTLNAPFTLIGFAYICALITSIIKT